MSTTQQRSPTKKFLNFNEIIEKSKQIDQVDIKQSKKTEALKQYLDKQLMKEGKYIGYATDLGCCFYDAVAQGLRQLGFTGVTIKSLRQQIYNYVNELEEAQKLRGANNWVKQMKKQQRSNDVSYEKYKENVQYTSREAEMRDDFPIWGEPNIDGRIISELHGIKIRIYEVGLLDEKQPPVEGNIYFGDSTVIGDKNLGENRTVEIAIYPGHFVPVLKRKGAIVYNA